MRLRLLAPALLYAAVACARSAAPEPVFSPPPPPSVGASPTTSESGTPGVVLAGKLSLPAAQAFGQPGFHEVLTASGSVPKDAAGATLSISLRDATRPTQTCSADHPLSGCATVDWSDDPSRPNVPPNGVFVNSITVQLESGERTLYLSQSGTLADAPDPFVPG